MMSVVNTTSARQLSLHGTWQIVRFNWPQYAAAAALTTAAIVVIIVVPVSWACWLVVVAGAGCGVFWLVGSLIASYWVYDRSGLTDWTWLIDHLPTGGNGVHRWVNVHCGFDDTTSRLRTVLPGTQSHVVDLFDPDLMTERSIHRARRTQSLGEAAIAGKPDRLPLADALADVVFLLFAAHELRQEELRTRLFDELHRVTKSGGRIVLVEHVRDLWNFLAFGPGCWHFFPWREWRRLARAAGFRIRAEGHKTPLVRYLILER